MADEAKRYAVVNKAGTVQNVIIAHNGFDPGEGLRLVSDGHAKAEVGGTLAESGRSFAPPPAPRARHAMISKADIWNRMSDVEAEMFSDILKGAPAKVRGTWNDSVSIDEGGPMFDEVTDLIMAVAKTKKRFLEIMGL